MICHEAISVDAESVVQAYMREHREENESVGGGKEYIAQTGASVGNVEECRALGTLWDEPIAFTSCHTQ